MRRRLLDIFRRLDCAESLGRSMKLRHIDFEVFRDHFLVGRGRKERGS
ncbi:MAG: hypothetical protein JOZ54_11855 [Acidobacteria bacterium]|nr:hypothetical protein [Acidobacteriota bacterium]